MLNDFSLNDFCIPAKQMKFSLDVDIKTENKNEQMVQE